MKKKLDITSFSVILVYISEITELKKN